jgi:hypothetical protein
MAADRETGCRDSGWQMTKPRSVSFFEIGVRELKRDGCLVPGSRSKCTEHVNGRQRSRCEVIASRNHVDLAHCGNRLSVKLTTTAVHPGRARVWFLCPQCDRRAAILYGSPFACRTCRRIAYECQREDTRARRIRRAVKLRRGLGGSGSLLEPVPPRPKECTIQRIGALRRVA